MRCLRDKKKKGRRGAQKKEGENSPISPPLDPRLLLYLFVLFVLLVPICFITFNNIPQCIQSLFKVRENKKNLRGKNKLVLPVAKTTTYSLKSTSYIAAKAWNVLPDNVRSLAEFGPFRNEIRKLSNL